MAEIKVTIDEVRSDVCSLTGKEVDGLQVRFEDGTVNGFLS